MPPKRKRAASAAAKDAQMDDVADSTTPSTSAALAGGHAADAVTAPVHDDDDTNQPADPPAKRTRANSKRLLQAELVNGSNGKQQLSISTGGRVSMPVNGASDGQGEHGEAGTMRMEAPPKAGTVDPEGGYKTNPPPSDRPVRIYADGVFDLFHLGHMRVLQQAKTAFPNTYLIVGVTGDHETHKRKGLTVMSAKERAESVRHCRWVDEVIEDCPWIIDVEFLQKHNIDYVAHDDLPYGASEGDDIYAPIKEKGMFLVTQRTEGVSTTGIITKIVRDYEQYIARQLKRGTSRQELNISWIKKNELDIKRHVADLRDTIRTNWSTTGRELSNEFKQFWGSRPSSPAPSTTPSLRNGASPLPSGTADRLKDSSSLRSSTPTKGRGGNLDFAAGYAMGLIGGVKGWMEGSKRRNLSDSRGQSPTDSPERSPIDDDAESSRGRKRPTTTTEEKVVHARDS
jgi:choline-phosphate cytidylyltransferase